MYGRAGLPEPSRGRQGSRDPVVHAGNRVGPDNGPQGHRVQRSYGLVKTGSPARGLQQGVSSKMWQIGLFSEIL